MCVSECIKIQPSDIQPDVFSYLLHVMYTGHCPKQPVDPTRLQDGIRFLHAYQLCRTPGEGAADADATRMSNLYGIQISSQLANKEVGGAPKSSTAARSASEDGRQGGRLEGVPSDHRAPTLRNVCSVASGDDSDISTRIKQEREEEEEVGGQDGEERQGVGSPAEDGSPVRERLLVLPCPRCGERCSSPRSLREHLFSHALDPAHLEVLSQSGADEGPAGTTEPLDAGCLEEALRQSQALADQLAAELQRSRGGGGGAGGSPASANLHSRKRRIACAVCSLRFAHKSQLQEHMYTHTGKPARAHRYNRLCSQILHASAHLCEVEPGGGGGASVGGAALSDDTNRDAQDNGSSCYSLDSEVSQGSVDGAAGE